MIRYRDLSLLLWMLVVHVRAVGTVEIPTVLFDDSFKFLESHRVSSSDSYYTYYAHIGQKKMLLL